MLSSNAEQVFGNLIKIVEKYRPDDALLSQLAFHVHASNIRRVHQQGLNPQGRAIGKYSVRPIYVNPSQSPVKFSPRGKNGGTVFNNGKRRKTRYFAGGYKGFKKQIGRLRETDNVNLRLFGDLQRGFIPEKRGNKWVIGLVGSQVEKYSHLEKKYGPAYGVSKQDQEFINQILKKRLQQIK